MNQDTNLEKCDTHGLVKRELHIVGSQIKANCSICGKFIKFIDKKIVCRTEKLNYSKPLF